jgi:hypothetical protein
MMLDGSIANARDVVVDPGELDGDAASVAPLFDGRDVVDGGAAAAAGAGANALEVVVVVVDPAVVGLGAAGTVSLLLVISGESSNSRMSSIA